MRQDQLPASLLVLIRGFCSEGSQIILLSTATCQLTIQAKWHALCIVGSRRKEKEKDTEYEKGQEHECMTERRGHQTIHLLLEEEEGGGGEEEGVEEEEGGEEEDVDAEGRKGI